MDTVTTSIASSSPDSRSPPYDVIFEILLQLPVMILLMMKCVSRFWNFIISSPQFIKAHLKLSTKKQDLRLLFNDSLGHPQFYTCPLSSILYESHQRHLKLDFPCKNYFGEYKIEGSSNGLLCISISRRDLFVWNPPLRELKKLPPSLASGIVTYGFCYVESQHEFKIVQVVGSSIWNDKNRLNTNEFFILNSRSNSWKKFLVISGACFGMESAVCTNERMYWIVDRGHEDFESWFVASLDVIDMAYTYMPLPIYIDNNVDDVDEGNDVDVSWTLGLLRGKLSVCCHYRVYTDLWIMGDNGWSKIAAFSILCHDVEIFKNDNRFRPLCMHQNDDILVQNASKVMVYSSSEKAIKHIRKMPYSFQAEAVVYVESLFSPNVVEIV